jgi:hypothetical protein
MTVDPLALAITIVIGALIIWGLFKLSAGWRASQIEYGENIARYVDFHEAIEKMSLEEARTRAEALLANPDAFSLEPIDPSELASVRFRVSSGLFEVWGKYGGLQEGPAHIKPGKIEPLPDWYPEFPALLTAEGIEPGDVTYLGEVDESVLLLVSKHNETVYSIDIEGHFLVTSYQSIYHWIVSRDPTI